MLGRISSWRTFRVIWGPRFDARRSLGAHWEEEMLVSTALIPQATGSLANRLWLS